MIVCPFRVQGEQKYSSFRYGEFTYNEYFMPCLENDCPCFCECGNEIRCNRDHISLILKKEDEEVYQ